MMNSSRFRPSGPIFQRRPGRIGGTGSQLQQLPGPKLVGS
jgi:hypothetical protein